MIKKKNVLYHQLESIQDFPNKNSLYYQCLKNWDHAGVLDYNSNRSISCMLSCVWFFAAPWTVARQAPLSMGFSRQEYQNRLPCSPPGASSRARDRTQVSCITGRFFITWATRETPHNSLIRGLSRLNVHAFLDIPINLMLTFLTALISHRTSLQPIIPCLLSSQSYPLLSIILHAKHPY